MELRFQSKSVRMRRFPLHYAYFPLYQMKGKHVFKNIKDTPTEMSYILSYRWVWWHLGLCRNLTGASNARTWILNIFIYLNCEPSLYNGCMPPWHYKIVIFLVYFYFRTFLNFLESPNYNLWMHFLTSELTLSITWLALKSCTRKVVQLHRTPTYIWIFQSLALKGCCCCFSTDLRI